MIPGLAPSADVSRLRARLAAMGGVAGVARPVQQIRVEAHDAAGRAMELGFLPIATSAGVAYRRASSVRIRDRETAWSFDATTVADLPLLLARQNAAPEPECDGDVVVLDIETLGLRGSGVVAFLVGLARRRGGEIDVEQFYLADPDGEAALLSAVIGSVRGSTHLVTYNGLSFDIPVMLSRCIINRINGSSLCEPMHVDVLHAVRRLFRDRLGSCTLAQAEAGLLDFHRVDDIPGAEAPARYHAWVRGAAPSMINGIIEHNHTDVVSTLLVALRCAAHVRGRGVAPPHPADAYRLALHFERHPGLADGDIDGMLRKTAATARLPWSRHAARRLATRLARRGDPVSRAEATQLLEHLWRGDPWDLRAARSLAIALQRRGDRGAALRVCEEVMARLRPLPRSTLDRIRGAPRHGWADDWERRLSRLARTQAG